MNDRIKLLREEVGLTQAEVSSYLHISQPAYQRIEKGSVKNPRELESLAALFKTTPEYLLFGAKETVPVHLIPLLSWSEAPYPSDLSIIDEKEGVLPMANHAKGNCYALTIKDDSMTSKSGDKRSFLEGDIIIIDPHAEPSHGSYVLIREKDAQEAILKQYLIHGSSIILSSLNERYPSISYEQATITICGVAIKKQEDLK
ncbi:MAG: LexA family protein [Gammaproteobacteria bacterium]